MTGSVRSRLAGLVAVLAVVLATLVPALPAAALASITYPPSEPGPVSISNATTPFEAITPVGGAGNWPSGTTFTYQWLRGNTATTATIPCTGLVSSTATTSAYTPNIAESDEFMRVKVTAAVPGYSPVVRYSDATNFSIYSTGSMNVAGTPKVGTEVTVDTSGMAFFTPAHDALSGVTFEYQWLRPHGVPPTDTPAVTADATDDADYTLRPADYNSYVYLRIIASKPGWVPKFLASGLFFVTQKGTIQATSPAADITNTYDPLAPTGVVLTATDSGVTETELSAPAYQWYRVNLTTSAATLIAGATTSVYKPVAADYPYKIRVVITIKKPSYTSIPLSFTRDFSLRIGPAPFALDYVGGPVQVDSTIGLDLADTEFHAEISPGSFNTVHFGSPGAVREVKWRRAGVVVGGQTGDTYLLGSADVGKVMSYSVKVSYNGFIAFNGTSPNTAAVAAATFSQVNTLGVDGATLTKSVAATLGDVTPAATSMKFQWLRDGVAIVGTDATDDNDYTLTAADYGKSVAVKVSYLRAGYTTFPITSTNPLTAGRYWVEATPAAPHITFGGTSVPKVGGTLTLDPRTYVDKYTGGALTSGDFVEKFQWLRDGVALSSADAKDDNDYTLVAADKGHRISVKITVSAPNAVHAILPSISTTPSLPAIGTNVLAGWDATETPALIALGSSTASATVVGLDPAVAGAGTGVTEAGVTRTYVWYRDAAIIAGQTHATYTLTQADRNHKTWVRVTTSKKASGSITYTSVTQNSTRVDFTLQSSGAAGFFTTGAAPVEVGSELGFGLPSYFNWDLSTQQLNGTLTFTKQWYRNGVAITAAAGGTASTYIIKPADAGTKITGKLTVGKPGFIPLITTYATSPAVMPKGTLIGAVATAPTVTLFDGPTNTLIANPPAGITGSVIGGSTPATFTYQWLRNGVNIAGQTASKYKLVAADVGQNIKVRATANLTGYTSVILPESTPIIYSILPSPTDPPRTTGNTWGVGTQIQVVDDNFFDAYASSLSPDSVTFEWLRKIGSTTKVVATGPGSTYTLQAADLGATFTARLTVKKGGYVPLVFTTAPNGNAVIKGTDTDTWTPVVQSGPGVGILTAAISDLDPVTPAPVYTYKWLRNGVAIAGATAKTYKLVALDSGKGIKVQVTMTRAAFNPLVTPTKQSIERDYTIYANGDPATVTNNARVGQLLQATPPSFFDDATFTTATTGITYVYTWYRSGAVIAGAKSDTYKLALADLNKVITVKATATMPGRLAASSAVSTPTDIVSLGDMDQGTYEPIVTLTGTTTLTGKVTFQGVMTDPVGGFAISYRWTRDGVAIPGKTTNTYTLVSADQGHELIAEVTLKKAGYNPLVLPVSANEISSYEAAALLKNGGAPGAQAHVGDVLEVVPPLYYVHGQYPSGSALPSSAGAIQWFCNSDEIPGATATSYTVLAGDLTCNIQAWITVNSPFMMTTNDHTSSVFIN